MSIETSKLLIPIMAVLVAATMFARTDSPLSVARAATAPDAGHYTVVTKRGGYEENAAMEVCYRGTTYVIFNPYSNGAIASVEFVDGKTVACK